MIGTRPPNTLIAAASKRTIQQIRNTPASQDSASLWALYDRLGELGYGIGFKANAAARLHYFPAEKTDGEPEPTDNPDAVAAFQRIQGPAGDFGDFVSELVTHRNVVGEGFLVGQKTGDEEQWDVWSSDELKRTRAARQNPDEVQLEDTDPFILRIWSPHPRDRAVATSPLMHVKDTAERLILIRGALDSAMRSRLIGKFLFIPDELTIVPNTQLPDSGAEADNDPFMKEIIETIITAVRDDRSAARIAPILVRGPGDRLQQIQALDLVRDLPERLIDMEQAAVKALAAGMDLPAEILLGLTDTNHWSAWLVDESAYRQHVDPEVQAILDSLTRGYLWPTLEEMGVDNPRDFLFWRDITPVTIRSVTIPDAINLYKEGIISDDAVRGDAGYTDRDAPAQPPPGPAVLESPNPTDRLLPQMTAALASIESRLADIVTPVETTTTPAIVLSRLAEIDRSLRDKITEAAQAELDRALERAGAKIRSHARKDRAVTDKIAPSSVTNMQVAAILGPDIVHRLQLNENDLVSEDSFDRLAKRTDHLFEQAQDATWDELENLTGQPVARNEQEAKSWRQKAGAFLISGMVAVGLSRLFKPDAKPDPSETGEIGDTAVPAKLIRDAMSMAGGNTPSDLPGPSGLALGESSIQTLADSGVGVAGYRWEYG